MSELCADLMRATRFQLDFHSGGFFVFLDDRVMQNSEFGIGDTLTNDRSITYDEIPRFPSEVFTYISNPNTGDAKKYRAGVEQLLQEGVVQSFNARNAPPGATLLAAVGPLQFEVFTYRMETEFNAKIELTSAPYEAIRLTDDATAREQGVGQ
jgi:peptide chain release factor 3